MTQLDRIWNGWRSQYVNGAGTRGADAQGSVFTQILASGLDDETTHIVHRGAHTFAILNAFPYTSGHLMVLPYRGRQAARGVALMTLKVRELQPDDDAVEAGALVQGAYFRLPGYPRDDEYDLRLGDVASRAQDALVVVAVDDGQLVGCLTYLADMSGPHGEFDDADAASFRYFGVHPSAQGSGVGVAMVQCCNAWACTPTRGGCSQKSRGSNSPAPWWAGERGPRCGRSVIV